MIENLNKKQKIIIGIVVLAVIVGIATYFIIKNNQYEEFDMNNFVRADAEEYKGDTIIVHITGEVKEPGIKELPDEARIADAIEAAGGVTENADLDEVNLAFVLSDGQKIYIPNKN